METLKTLETTSVDIILELIRLTQRNTIKWIIKEIPMDEHEYYRVGLSGDKHIYVKINTEVLNKSITIGVLSGYPKWVKFEDKVICGVGDANLQQYTKNPVKYLYHIIVNGSTENEELLTMSNWLQQLKNM